MKVLHVIISLAPHSGGPTTVLNALAAHQVRAGLEVTVCTTNTDNPAGTLDVPVGQPVCEGGVTKWYFPVQFAPLALSWPLKQWLDRHVVDFDVVHVHGLYRFPATYAAWRARRAGVAYLIRPHGNLDPFLYRQSSKSLVLKRLYERWFDLPNLHAASAIHYTAADEEARAAFLQLRAPGVVVANGLDLQDFATLPARGAFRKRLGLENDTPLVLFLGRLNFKKGLDLLVPAFARLVGQIPAAHLAIVGPDNEGLGREVRRWCREQGVERQVSFVDHLPPAEVREAYVDADVFALTSYTENFGMTVAEAMACGCPVVISDQVNIWREVDAAGAGRVVGLDAVAIADALHAVLTDPVAAHQMGLAGRRLVQEKYSWPVIVDELNGIYKALVCGES